MGLAEDFNSESGKPFSLHLHTLFLLCHHLHLFHFTTFTRAWQSRWRLLAQEDLLFFGGQSKGCRLKYDEDVIVAACQRSSWTALGKLYFFACLLLCQCVLILLVKLQTASATGTQKTFWTFPKNVWHIQVLYLHFVWRLLGHILLLYAVVTVICWWMVLTSSITTKHCPWTSQTESCLVAPLGQTLQVFRQV